MTTTTQPGVASAATAEPQDTVDQFQSLWDSGATDEQRTQPPPAAVEPLEAQDLNNAAVEGAGEATQAEPTEGAEKTAATKVEPEKTETEDKAYTSLDEYLKDAKVDPESFMTLPVTVKVDGKESAVPLGELVKGYQLSSASYDRMQQLATERQAFSNEQTQVRQALGIRIQQAEALLKGVQDQLLGDYNAITPQQWQQMRAEKPGEYAALMTDFQQRQQALQQQLQQVAQAKEAEARAANQQSAQALAQERERLFAVRPDWRDPTKFQAVRQGVLDAGRKLGFTDAELSGLSDHRHLLVLDLAAQALKNQASQPAVLKRVRAAPPMAKPGTRQVRDPKQVRAQSAREAYERSGGRNDDAGAAYFEQFA